MITRITKATIRDNAEARVFEVLRQATQAHPRPPGLVDIVISRQVKANATEVVAITVWEDLESMISVVGPNWREPSWLPALGDAVIDDSLEILETVVTSYDGLLQLSA